MGEEIGEAGRPGNCSLDTCYSRMWAPFFANPQKPDRRVEFCQAVFLILFIFTQKKKILSFSSTKKPFFPQTCLLKECCVHTLYVVCICKQICVCLCSAHKRKIFPIPSQVPGRRDRFELRLLLSTTCRRLLSRQCWA